MLRWIGLKKSDLYSLGIIQMSIVYLSISGIFAKKLSSLSYFSNLFLLYAFLIVFIVGTYAIVWQQIIKHFDISIAYANKGTSIIWIFLWSNLFFGETITLRNMIGALIVMIGVIVVSRDEN